MIHQEPFFPFHLAQEPFASLPFRPHHGFRWNLHRTFHGSFVRKTPPPSNQCNIGASIIRIGFWSPLYYNENKEPPKQYR